MSTGIQWTDETWNPVVGCDQVSPGCAHCYAKTLHDMRHRAFLAGKKVAPQYAEPFETVQLKPERLTLPLSWKRPRKIFVNSVSDLFHDDVPDAYIDRVFAVMAAANHHTFQVLTKRPQRMLTYLTAPGLRERIGWAANDALRSLKGAQRNAFQNGPFLWRECEPWAPGPWKYRLSGVAEWPLPNVWLGVSVENQRFADERIPLLLATTAAVRFLSCEPLLGPLDLEEFLPSPFGCGGGARNPDCEACGPNGISWVIIGGESGAGARPFNIEWASPLIRQCRDARVAPFVKQLGAVPVVADLTHWKCPATLLPDASGYALRLRDSHGGDPEEWPLELRLREFPASPAVAGATG